MVGENKLITQKSKILLFILFALYLCMSLLYTENTLTSIVYAICFGVVLILFSMYFLKREQEKAQDDNQDSVMSLYGKKVFGSIAISVAIYIVLQVVGMMLGLDMMEYVGPDKLPLVLVLLACVMFPFVSKYMK